MKRVAGFVVPLLAGAVLTGCVSAPERRAPELEAEVPEQWSADEDRMPGALGIRWWETFGDPQLVKLVDLALERNHDLRAAVARLDRAAAQA